MNRLTGVDVVRVVAVIAVIIIHTTPFAHDSAPLGSVLDLATLLNQAARFAVPFFLILSGYFWAPKVKGELGVVAPSVTMAKRIGFVFLAWSAIYLFPTNLADALAHGPGAWRSRSTGTWPAR